jgi:hypothetical protein
MKPWWILAACIMLAAGLGFIGCPGRDRQDADEEGRRSHDRSSALAAGPGDESGGRKASKRQRKEGDAAQAAIRAKLKSIIIPKVTFGDTSLEEAIDFLRIRTRELDPETNTNIRGVSLNIRKEAQPEGRFVLGSDASLLRIKELVRNDISAWELLHEIAHETGMKVEITDTGIEMVPRE